MRPPWLHPNRQMVAKSWQLDPTGINQETENYQADCGISSLILSIDRLIQ